MAAADEFWKVFGRGTSYRDFTDEDRSRLNGRLPDVMIALLEADGWCWYQDQGFWLCDPDDWDGIVPAWEPDIKNSYMIARSGFGDFLFSDGTTFYFVMVHDARSMLMVPNGDWTFGRMLTVDSFFLHSLIPGMMVRARKAGPLEWDEMYTYVPAIALGGSFETSKIERVKAREQLLILASLAPLQRA